MRGLILIGVASALLSGCASSSADACRKPTERELRQGHVQGVLASCRTSEPVQRPAAAAPEGSKP
jgi:hypothetical protein